MLMYNSSMNNICKFNGHLCYQVNLFPFYGSKHFIQLAPILFTVLHILIVTALLEIVSFRSIFLSGKFSLLFFFV